MFIDPCGESLVEGVGEDNGGVHGGELWGGENDTKAKTSGAAAVLHGLANVEVMNCGDDVLTNQPLHDVGGVLIFLNFSGAKKNLIVG